VQRPIKRYLLDGTTIHSLDDFYDQLIQQLALPKQFGRNLDALWDVLSTDIEGPYEIVWHSSQSSRVMIGQDFDRIIKIFHELESERNDFTLVLT
jgi:ribonuclease inhibitor